MNYELGIMNKELGIKGLRTFNKVVYDFMDPNCLFGNILEIRTIYPHI